MIENLVEQPSVLEFESIDDRLDEIKHELDLALRWARPSILFAIHNLNSTRESTKGALEKIIRESGQTVIHQQFENYEKINLSQFVAEFSRQPIGSHKEVYFIDPTTPTGPGGLGGVKIRLVDQLVTLLNSCGGTLIDNLIRAVFWITEEEALKIAHQSPDFWASRHRVFEFFYQADVMPPSPTRTGALSAPSFQTSALLKIEGVSMPLTNSTEIITEEITGESALVMDISGENEQKSNGINLLLMIGVANWKDHNYEKAIESLQSALAIAEKTGNLAHQATVHKAIALVSANIGKEADAIQSYKKVIELGPAENTIWNNLGLLLHKKGQTNDAVNAFSAALKKDPQDSVSWNGLGVVYEQIGKLDEAIGCFRKAIQFNAGYKTPWIRLGDVLSKQNRTEDALYAYMRIVEMDNTNVHALSEIGNIYLKAGSFEQAIDAFKKALLLGVDNAMLFSNLAEAYSLTGNFPEAINAYKKAIDRETNADTQATIWNKLGDVYRRLNEYDLAVSAYETADRLSPNSNNDIEQQIAIDQLENSRNSHPGMQSEKKTVGLNPAAGDIPIPAAPLVVTVAPDTAMPIATEVIGTAPVLPILDVKNAQLWSRLGSTYLKAGAVDRAIEAYQKSIGMDPKNGTLCCALAEIFVMKSEVDNAIFYYRQSIDVFSASQFNEKAISLSIIGDLYRQKKEFISALDAFEAALSLDPENETILAGLTKVQEDLDQAGSGKKSVTKATVSKPINAVVEQSPVLDTGLPRITNSVPLSANLNNANVWNELGNIFTRSRTYEDAVSAYNKAIELNPDYGWAYSNLASILARQGKRLEAINLYQKSIELLWTDADKTVALNRLGDVYRQVGRYADAIDAYQAADRLNQGSNAFSSIREVILDQFFPHFVS